MDTGITRAAATPAASGECASVKGLHHQIIETAKAGAAVPIAALVASDVPASKVAVMYRPEGATEFSEAKLKKEGDCKYTGSIPSSADASTTRRTGSPSSSSSWKGSHWTSITPKRRDSGKHS